MNDRIREAAQRFSENAISVRIRVVALHAARAVSEEARFFIDAVDDRPAIDERLGPVLDHIEVLDGEPTLHAKPVREGKPMLRRVDFVARRLGAFGLQADVVLDEAGADGAGHLVLGALLVGPVDRHQEGSPFRGEGDRGAGRDGPDMIGKVALDRVLVRELVHEAVRMLRPKLVLLGMASAAGLRPDIVRGQNVAVVFVGSRKTRSEPGGRIFDHAEPFEMPGRVCDADDEHRQEEEGGTFAKHRRSRGRRSGTMGGPS
jgi:hypothetical protein